MTEYDFPERITLKLVLGELGVIQNNNLYFLVFLKTLGRCTKKSMVVAGGSIL